MLFLYLDESGNYTFSKDGSEYLIYTSLVTTNPSSIYGKLCDLEKDLKAKGIILESGYFHASEDKQAVRDEVYKVLHDVKGYEIDSVYVEKCKTNPSIRDLPKLYKKVYGILLKYVLKRYPEATKILIYLDAVPQQKRKEAILKGIKETLSEILKDKKNVKYDLLHMPSMFSYGLQATDYSCWAIKKLLGDWGQNQDSRPYKEIGHYVMSKFDLFATGDGFKYYQ